MIKININNEELEVLREHLKNYEEKLRSFKDDDFFTELLEFGHLYQELPSRTFTTEQLIIIRACLHEMEDEDLLKKFDNNTTCVSLSGNYEDNGHDQFLEVLTLLGCTVEELEVPAGWGYKIEIPERVKNEL